ncbi:MAG: glycerol-3-phosphate 1-O-acyltransferase PlsY [candidate division WOR-3 bacterium]|nr:glycerol-3-phosphate 1-O-acyltransferase PlsY [candidate division WOR-3 bacterium]
MNLLLFLPLDDSLANHFVSSVIGFIMGSIPFGYLIARIRKIDIRNYGSKNIGFTNVYRTLGAVYAVPVLILDVAKGFLPTFWGSKLGLTAELIGLSAILGHIFTPWLLFKGGKGVATTIGVLSALAIKVLGAGILVYIIILLAFSYVSLSSLFFAISLPIFTWLFYPQQKLLIGIMILISIVIIIRHKDNITRLIKKEEPRFSLSKKFKKIK